MRYHLNFLLCAAVFGLAGCATPLAQKATPSTQASLAPQVAATPKELSAGAQVGLTAQEVGSLINTPLFQMRPAQAGRYIGFMQALEPDFRARIAAIARHNIGQPYVLNLLGEFPFEIHDELPLFSLTHSDCVVFIEHTYAMAMSHSWEEFFWMLQRIRYRDGVIGVATRNHYTELDWNRNNAWLVRDISTELTGVNAARYAMTVDREKFLRTRHHTEAKFAVEKAIEHFITKDKVEEISAQLKEGDFVNVISSRDGNFWASHVGLVVKGADGQIHFLHSSDPMVREESFASFIARATEREERAIKEGRKGQVLAGFKFLRLQDAPVVPPMAAQPRPSSLPPLANAAAQ